MDQYRCCDCGAVFATRFALGGHRSRQNCGRHTTDAIILAPYNSPPRAADGVTYPPPATVPATAVADPPVLQQTYCQLIQRPPVAQNYEVRDFALPVYNSNMAPVYKLEQVCTCMLCLMHYTHSA